MRVTFYPFGVGRSGDVNTDKLFTGQRLDATGLYYYGARYYDAGIGRFISADTVVQSPGNPQTLNRYSYCLNNPLKYIDPSGHDVELTEAEVMLLIEQEIERQEREERAESNSGTNGEPDMPVENDSTEYTVVWGYADEFPVFPVLFSYYHSVIVVQNQNGDYFIAETWGGGVALGGEIMSEIWQVGETVKIEDGKWVGSGGIRMPFIDLEPHFQIQSDIPYAQGGLNKHFHSGLGITIGIQITRQSVTRISHTEIYNNMPRWVINAYRRLGYDFAK